MVMSRHALSDQARLLVLFLAKEEAHRLHHDYIGTEHILLGIVGEPTRSVAQEVIENLGVELTKIRSTTEFAIGRSEKIVHREIKLTPRAKKVIGFAADEARRLNHSSIGTEHLLIALLREGKGVPAGILNALGITLEKVRAEVYKVSS